MIFAAVGLVVSLLNNPPAFGLLDIESVWRIAMLSLLAGLTLFVGFIWTRFRRERTLCGSSPAGNDYPPTVDLLSRIKFVLAILSATQLVSAVLFVCGLAIISPYLRRPPVWFMKVSMSMVAIFVLCGLATFVILISIMVVDRFFGIRRSGGVGPESANDDFGEPDHA
ncbi:hypothetical protein [Stratiformator vulcanicus]|uniref:hypothetical protein n=1 Tax=Stratiformator vulcanicus TaxID=2527980 RepID=UPI00119ED028|nr:hypothetical protein [Stratiformator vulcanicus]